MTDRARRLSQVMLRVDGIEPGNHLEKHTKMAHSPFVMLRGASSQFYDDLSTGLIKLPDSIEQWPLTTVMGDCHISNFGLFSEEGSHGDQVIFAPNDFDDACIGHAGWDLLRFAVSLVLCADHCKGVLTGTYPPAEPISKKQSVNDEQVALAVRRFLQTYIKTCQKLADHEWNYDQDLEAFPESHVLYKRFAKALSRISGGDAFDEKSSLAKAVDLNQEPLRFRDLPERFQRLPETEYQTLKQAFAPYVDDSIIDIVIRQGAGTGSVNMLRYYLLVGPKQYQSECDLPLYHIVEVKQQRSAAPLHEFTSLSQINRLNPAHLTVICQRRMQRNPDLILDELYWRDSHWLVRSRHHARVGISPEHIACGKRALNGGFIDYAAACGEALALAHGRGDRRSRRFEQAVVAGLPGAMDDLLKSIYSYSHQVKNDWFWLAGLEKN